MQVIRLSLNRSFDHEINLHPHGWCPRGLTLEQMRLALRHALSFLPKSNSIISFLEVHASYSSQHIMWDFVCVRRELDCAGSITIGQINHVRTKITGHILRGPKMSYCCLSTIKRSKKNIFAEVDHVRES